MRVTSPLPPGHEIGERGFAPFHETRRCTMLASFGIYTARIPLREVAITQRCQPSYSILNLWGERGIVTRSEVVNRSERARSQDSTHGWSHSVQAETHTSGHPSRMTTTTRSENNDEANKTLDISIHWTWSRFSPVESILRLGKV